MPQGPLGAYVAKAISNALAPLILDAVNLLTVTRGGISTALDLTAATVIKGSAGRIAKVVVVAGGTASDGAFELNDSATTGGASAANEIISIPAGTAAGTVIDLDWPCANGITLSAVPSAGSPILAVSYT